MFSKYSQARPVNHKQQMDIPKDEEEYWNYDNRWNIEYLDRQERTQKRAAIEIQRIWRGVLLRSMMSDPGTDIGSRRLELVFRRMVESSE